MLTNHILGGYSISHHTKAPVRSCNSGWGVGYSGLNRSEVCKSSVRSSNSGWGYSGLLKSNASKSSMASSNSGSGGILLSIILLSTRASFASQMYTMCAQTKTRMHSSRMLTARVLTIFPGVLPPSGSCCVLVGGGWVGVV